MATLNEKKTCSQRMEDFRRFVWNPETKLFMGRSLINWVWISLYYLAFYVVMSGLFALSIYSLMRTINPYEPDYQDQLKSPGVTLRPDVYGDRGLQIYYNISDNKTWEGLVTTLHTFLTAYTPAAQHLNIDCTNNTYFIQDTFDGPNNTKLSCKFTSDMLQNCSGITDPTFGFPEGKPCFIIKMNRGKYHQHLYLERNKGNFQCLNSFQDIDKGNPWLPGHQQGPVYGWVIELDSEEMQCYLLCQARAPLQCPSQIIKFLPGNGTAPRVNCTYVDEESRPLEVDYYPVNGTFNLHYFPYYGKKAQPSYSNPLVAVKFLNITRNAELKIVCKIIGAGITFDNVHDPYEGKVEFKLKIED